MVKEENSTIPVNGEGIDEFGELQRSYVMHH